MHKHKLIVAFRYVLLFSIIISLTIGMVVSASRVDDLKGSPADLAIIQQYNKAMETCIDGSLSGFNYDTSGSGSYKAQNAQNSYQRFLGQRYFFNEYSGPLIYSEEFEKNVSQGSYDGGVFGSGNDDGKMYCGENESAIFHNAMAAFGISEDKDNLKKLYCDGNNSGIYTITKKKYDSNYKVVEEDSNCGENFDLFVQYAENNVLDPVYSISVTVNDGAVDHYKKWFKENVGDFNTLSSQEQKAIDYAKFVHDLQAVCSITGPSTSPIGSKSELAVYDTFSGKGNADSPVYYQIGVEADKEFYTGIDNKTKNTCADIAANLTQEGAAAYAAVANEEPLISAGSNTNPATSEENDLCYDESGALGWVMCPLIVKLNDTLGSIYDEMVEPFLVVDWELASPYVPKKDANGNVIYITVPKKDVNGNDLKDTDGNVITEQQVQYEQEYDEDGNPVYNDDGTPVNRKTGTYQAWEIFRNIANTLFFVLFIIVIFSQITGFGIDNYGIKRILPKLIVAAVLINLSFIICQLAVDISNALGSGFNAMLSNLAIPDAKYSEVLWREKVEKVTIYQDRQAQFNFKDGTVIKVQI